MDRDEEQRRRRGEHTRSYSQDRPIGSGENASALIRGIKQWLPDIPGSVGDLVDMAYAGGRNVLQGQKQRSIPSLGLGEKARKLVKQRPALEQVQMTETPETNWLEEGTRMLNPAMFMSPKNIATMGGLALAGGMPGASMAIVKPRGGNWFTGSGSELESAIKRLMKGSQDNYHTLLAKGMIDEAAVKAKPEYALNKWLEGPLTRYLKRDFATESDPVRKLLEGDRPVSHMNLDDLLNTAREGWISQEALRNREKAGLPRVGVGQGGYGQAWETVADAFTRSNPAGEVFRDYHRFDPAHPMSQEWVAKLPEETPIYDFMGDEAPDFLGLPHLRDELWNAVREDSDLPQQLKLRPEDFQQLGIEKAIRHVANINDWRAQQQAAANIEMLNGPGVNLVREYPENNPKGLRWVDLTHGDDESATEALRKQLKYEGDTMGHCVGGYCDDVTSGRTKIFSLRDAKGEPHVTVEVAPEIPPSSDEKWYTYVNEAMDPDEAAAMRRALTDKATGKIDFDRMRAEVEALPGYGTWTTYPRLIQIKGKQNRAPNAEYMPFVKDFLQNPYHGTKWHGDELGDVDTLGLSPEDLDKIPVYRQDTGYANGGLVGKQDFNGVVGYILD